MTKKGRKSLCLPTCVDKDTGTVCYHCLQNSISGRRGTENLEDQLLAFKRKKILPLFPDEANGILRKEMLALFAKNKPVTKEEFFTAIPMPLRQKPDAKQLQFLDEIFEIIEVYTI